MLHKKCQYAEIHVIALILRHMIQHTQSMEITPPIIYYITVSYKKKITNLFMDGYRNNKEIENTLQHYFEETSRSKHDTM